MKKVTIEAVLLLPDEMGSSVLIAAIVDALEKLPDADEIKVEKLIFE
jgi:hypothetical protein